MGLVRESTPFTRERLLESAGEIFAECGFRAATIRDICQRAEANVAAVNYHFGDKERLYSEVLQYAHASAIQKYPPLPRQMEGASPEERLLAFVHSFLSRLLDQGRPAWHAKLIAREMVEPTTALDALVENSLRPQTELLKSIVRDLLGEHSDPGRVRLCVQSIVGQCLYHHHGRTIIQRLYPEQKPPFQDIEGLADHITRFSLAAIKHYGEMSTGPEKSA